jgi:hypothetical protein
MTQVKENVSVEQEGEGEDNEKCMYGISNRD